MNKIFLLAFCCAVAWTKPIVSASIAPIGNFVEIISQNTVEINIVASSNPHSYEPRPEQIAKLSKSELFFAVGVEFEKVWLPKFEKQFKNLIIIDTAKNIQKIHLNHDDDDDDDHHENHDHSGLDPHIWLDPVLVKTMAENIALALSDKFPQNAEIYATNLNKFKQQIDEIDKMAKDSLSNLKSRDFIVYHPSWGYFAKRYNLNQIAVEIDGKEPKPADLANLIKKAKEHNAKIIFVSPHFSQKSARLIAQQSGAVVAAIDELPKNWRENMEQIINSISKALK
nr:zinc ABC transporter substrate-binding protein [Campylobacter sp.]